MKKALLSLSLVGAMLFTISSCNLNNNVETVESIVEKESSSTEQIVVPDDYKNVLNSYKNISKAIITETTVVKDKSGKEDSSTRITNVDSSDNYCYATIKHGNVDGVCKKVSSSYYYSLGESGYIVEYQNTNDIYESIGISSIFDLTYTMKDNVASVFLTDSYKVAQLDTIFKNVNMDLATSYSYNKSSFVNIDIVFNGNSIDSIKFDLKYVYGSFYSEIVKIIKIEESDFKKETADLSSGEKYYVKTGDTLDTYVIELVKEYGDAIYIKSGDFDMLIDAGQQADGVNVDNILKEYCTDHVLECLVATHGHADHIGGFGGGALNSITDIGLIIDYGYTSNSDFYYERYRTLYNSDWYSAYDCVNFSNGAYKVFNFSDDLSIEILNTSQYSKKNVSYEDGDDNQFSVVFKLTYKNNTYLYTGDIDGNYDTYLEQEDVKDITVYKAAHHGAVSNNTNNSNFLNYINPEICIISAAIVDQKNFGAQAHPTKSFISRMLKASNISKSKNIYYNGTMGTIHLSDNGVNLPTVSGLGANRGYYYNDELVTGEENKKFTDTYFYKYR